MDLAAALGVPYVLGGCGIHGWVADSLLTSAINRHLSDELDELSPRRHFSPRTLGLTQRESAALGGNEMQT